MDLTIKHPPQMQRSWIQTFFFSNLNLCINSKQNALDKQYPYVTVWLFIIIFY